MAVLLADVSGKGMGAALLMSSTRNIVRLFAERNLPPSEILSNVNRVLLDDIPTAKFVTMIYAVLDADNRSVVFANAGHYNPLLVDQNGAIFLETDDGLPLGIRDDKFSERQIEMSPGTRLFPYSDGIVEAANSSSEEYDVTRIQAHAAEESASVVSLLTDVHSFMAGQPASDDMTIVMLRSVD